MLRTHLLLILFGALGAMQGTQAQSHFTTCASGASGFFNATVLVPLESTPEVNGIPLAAGSEIAVFSSDPVFAEQCVGVLVWQDKHAFLAIWGDDDLTPERDGLLAGELLHYRVWDRINEVEYGHESVQVSYAQGDGYYSNDAVLVLSALTVFGVPDREAPEKIQLYPNYPNPFSDVTTIAFGLPRKAHVMMEVYDLLGRQVATLLAEVLPAGQHEVRWEVHDLPSGVYLYRMVADGMVLRREFTVVRY